MFRPEVPVQISERKEDAIAEAQQQREFYSKETILLCKVLNIPRRVADKKRETE